MILSGRSIAIAFLLVCGTSCSTLRKLSHVEDRNPSSARSDQTISLVRQQMISITDFSHFCPRDVKEILPVIAGEKVMFPSCPQKLPQAYADTKEILSVEERSAIEQLVATDCHTLGMGYDESSLEFLLEGISPTRRSGGRDGEVDRPLLSDGMVQRRNELRDCLLEIKSRNEPLSQWIRMNGNYVLSEEQLEYFRDLILNKSCKLPSQALDNSYRMIHSLEELVRIQADNDPQRPRVEKLLHGMHEVMDKKIKEYFRR